jgi:hypothetical protein
MPPPRLLRIEGHRAWPSHSWADTGLMGGRKSRGSGAVFCGLTSPMGIPAAMMGERPNGMCKHNHAVRRKQRHIYSSGSGERHSLTLRQSSRCGLQSRPAFARPTHQPRSRFHHWAAAMPSKEAAATSATARPSQRVGNACPADGTFRPRPRCRHKKGPGRGIAKTPTRPTRQALAPFAHPRSWGRWHGQG